MVEAEAKETAKKIYDMSIASKLTTLNTLVNNIKAKLRSWSRLPTPAGVDDQGLEDCWDAINNISGTQSITNTNVVHVVANGKVDAQVSDANLIPSNIVSGVTILGVTGTGGGAPSHLNTDLLTINYGTADSIDKTTMASDVNLDYFTGVKLEVYPDSNPNKTLKPENIRDGVTILGVQGTFGSGFEHVSNSVILVNAPTNSKTISFNIGRLPGLSNDGIIYFNFFAYNPNPYDVSLDIHDVVCGYGAIEMNGSSGSGDFYCTELVNTNCIDVVSSEFNPNTATYSGSTITLTLNQNTSSTFNTGYWCMLRNIFYS